jgi:hypothetical protein
VKARWIRLGTLAPCEFKAACARIALAQVYDAPPILAWGDGEAHYLFALIAPRKFLPGRERRWLDWGLSSAVATYRLFGLPAYLEGGALALHGVTIGGATVEVIGECAVVASSFLAHFPKSCVATPSAELEEAFRMRLEAQHGWEFDHSWPTAPECVAETSS